MGSDYGMTQIGRMINEFSSLSVERCKPLVVVSFRRREEINKIERLFFVVAPIVIYDGKPFKIKKQVTKTFALRSAWPFVTLMQLYTRKICAHITFIFLFDSNAF